MRSVEGISAVHGGEEVNQRYQSLVRTAATLDALIDQEMTGDL
jgi:hypothetical protein